MKYYIFLFILICSYSVSSQESKTKIKFSISKFDNMLLFKPLTNYDYGNNNFSKYPTDVKLGYNINYGNIYRLNFTDFYKFQLLVEYKLNEKLYFNIGLSSSYKRPLIIEYKLWNSEFIDLGQVGQIGKLGRIIKRECNVNYITTPLIIDYVILHYKKLQVFNSIGLLPEFFIYNSRYLITYTYLMNSELSNSSFYETKPINFINKFLINIYFGTPIHYQTFNRLGIIIEPSIQYGLINLVKNTKRSNILSFELKLGIKLS
ncbi:MAG: hypothetical protein A2046_09000 [Bacteroidetes bacterium GWA2_30_7]|nr:MAG: hypothetical protein A2046_09000 [Bacteroidetes bacterium GWA2_30_7]